MRHLRIERLEGNKIKVTLSSADLLDYNINVKTLRPDSPQLHTFLFKIMERVQRETGFNPYTGQVVVEATPSSEGIVLVVTKISEEQPAAPKPPKSRRHVRAVKKAAPQKRIYCMGTFDDICALFEAVDIALLLECRLYAMEGKFYIVSEAAEHRAVLSEFGSALRHDAMTEAFLEEHGRLAAKGGALWKMAHRIKNLK